MWNLSTQNETKENKEGNKILWCKIKRETNHYGVSGCSWNKGNITTELNISDVKGNCW